MKTDLVLTMDEYLHQRCIATKHVRPPAPDARRILITAGDYPDSGAGLHGCRCDRWGHPCPGCVKSRHEAEQNAAIFGG
jgi:hypothetical protein